MCGICGLINFKKDSPPQAETLKRMSQAMVHRGPDDEGIYLGKHAGLGIRRLSIIDLVTGHQPIHNEDESIWLVFNGEIYNYKELRLELENLGHHFYTNTDTEVIVHAYEQYGEECVGKLRGMFTFAIWDERRQILFLARDRLGIKPLYYSVLKDCLIFASETKPLFESGMLEAKLNPIGIDSFFSFSYVPAPQTIFKGIQKLSPGHILVLKDGKINIKQYWQLDFSKGPRLSEEEYAGRLLALLEETIKIHLRSDVPIGIFLSGGIDSSTITYLVNQQGVKPIKSFSLGFDDETANELYYAKLVSDKFQTEHHEEVITDKAFDSLPDITQYLSEPLADFSIIPTYFVSKMAHTKVKVILCGEGGDEMFAGYDWYEISNLGGYYQKLPLGIRRCLSELAKKKVIKSLYEKSHFYRRLRTFLLYSSLPLPSRYLWRIAYFNEEQKENLFSEEFKKSMKEAKKDNYPLGEEERKFRDFLTAMLYFDTKFFLPDDLLAKMDQMSMAHSLEGRVPFLDHKLVEFTTSLPPDMKWRKHTSKYILRKLIASKLPDEILTKPKRGLMPPVQKWFNKRLGDFFIPILNDERTKERPYFNEAFISQMIEHHKKGWNDYSYQLWALVVFEIWLRIHLDRAYGESFA